MPVSVADLTLKEKAAQVLMPRIGSNMPPPVRVSEDLERIEALLERCPVGGLTLFNGSLPETPETLRRLQKKSRIPLLIGADLERGVGQQIRGATVFPHAMAFAHLGDEAEALLEASARAQAREALRCGIHITFSPVADVNRNPDNPIIATRAFGDEPGQVGRLSRAFIRGTRAEGMLATAKHFPGHGSTSADSHEELPVVEDDRATLDRLDLAPFRDAVAEDVDLIMTAHVVFPALDASGRPATLSRPILHDLLRDEMGFEGAVITDSLLMAAVQHAAGGNQPAALLAAGVDILLDVADPVSAAEDIIRGIETGAVTEARLDDAVRRILRLKQRLIDRFGETYFLDPATALPEEAGEHADAVGLAEAVAHRAVNVSVEAIGAIPIRPEAGDELLAVLVKPHRTRLDPPEQPFGEAIRSVFPGAHYMEVGPETAPADYREIVRRAEEAKHVVLALVVKPAAWHKFGLLEPQEAMIREIVGMKPVVLASLGTPHILERFPGAAASIACFSDVAASQIALARVLAGQVE
jgi:beta-N-acetylhexosaminidase